MNSNNSKLVNNYLTIDVSGTTPTNAAASGVLTNNTSFQNTSGLMGSSTNRQVDTSGQKIMIPRQKVLNIKLKENQFVPLTVTNKDRDSFRFTGVTGSNGTVSTHNLIQKVLGGGH